MRLIVKWRLASNILEKLHAALDRRPARYLTEPGLSLRKPLQILPLPSVSTDPGEGRHVRDAVFVARDPRCVFQPPLDDAVKAQRLAGIPLDGVSDVLPGVTAKMGGLTQHRPETAALKQQPLQRLRALRPACRKKPVA